MRYQEIVERLEYIEVKQSYSSPKMVSYAMNPSRADIFNLARGLQAPQLRGIALLDGCVVWPAHEAIHMTMVDALEKEGDFDHVEVPEEHFFLVAVEGQEIIFVGNPEPTLATFPRFTRVFDKIDIMGDEDKDATYLPSPWGIPAREGGWTSYIG